MQETEGHIESAASDSQSIADWQTRHEKTVGSRGHSRALFLILLVMFAIKLALYLLDPSPKFYFGDSASYLWTALSGWIPADRSFTYGFLLTALAVDTHSLAAVVVVQTFLSALSAWIVSLCLVRYFQTKTWIAAVGGVLCAVGPLQLISERFILTEAVSTFLFAVFVLLCLEYLRSGRLVVLVAIQVVALPLISLRLSYLPFVLAFSVLLPLLGPAARCVSISLWQRPIPSCGRDLVWVSVHLAIAITISQAGLYGYREWNGYLSQQRPAYMYSDGLFLLASVAPIVHPGDFPIPELRHPIFDNVKIDLRDPHFRIHQCFAPGGLNRTLIQKVNEKFGSDGLVISNRLARETAFSSIENDPIGFIRLSLNTWSDYFNSQYLADAVALEEGRTHPANDRFRQMIRQNFGQEYSEAWRSSPIQGWHKVALPWYQLLMVLPILFTVLTPFSRGQNIAQLIYLGVAAWIFMLPATVTAQPTVRYLVALEWMTPLLVGALLASWLPRMVRTASCPTTLG